MGAVWRNAVVLLIGITLIGSGILALEQKTKAVISPLAENPVSQAPFIVLFARRKNPQELREKIQKTIGNSWKNYSIFVKDFNSDFKLGINESVIFTAASVNKVPILATLYYLAQNSEVELDKIITLQEGDIQDYGTGTIRYDSPGTTYSVKTLARMMMQKSDNTAAYLLDNYIVGNERVQQLLNSWKLIQTDMTNNKTSNADMALLFEKIMHGKVTNQALTAEMLSFLKDSDFEDRLPAQLPENAVVFHKIGNGPGNFHDVGVIRDGKLEYYLGILTAEITDEDEATKIAASISRLVYDFLR